MNKKRVLIAGLLFGLVVGLFSACAPEPQPTATPVKSNTVAAPAPPTATNMPTATQPQPTNTATEEPTVAKPAYLTILHTNDVRGYVDPCG